MERHTFVVAFEREGGTVHRIIKVQNKSDVLAQAKRAFAVEGECRVEYFFDACAVYVEVDDLDELPDSGKLRLVPVLKYAPLVVTPTNLSTATTIDLSAGEPLVVGESVTLEPLPAVVCSPPSASSM